MVTGTSSVLDLADGSYIVAVRAYDTVGHYVESSVSFTVDTVTPTIVVSPIGDEIDIDAKIIIEFSERMDLSSIDIIVSNSVEGEVVFVDNIANFTPISELEYNREYTVTVTGKDLAGNAVSKTWTFSTMVMLGNVNGRIIDSNGQPIANATVTLSNGLSTVTNATGAFVFKDVEIGNYTVSIVKDGYVTMTTNATIDADVTKDIGNIAMTASGSAFTPSSDGTMLVVAAVGLIAIVALAAGLLFMRKKK
jgi:hypothetical protein